MTLVTLNIGLYLLSTLFLLCALCKKGQNWCLQLSFVTLIAGILSQGTLLSYQIAQGDFEQVSAIEALSVAVFIMLLIIIPYVRRHLNTAIGLTFFATIVQALSLFHTNEVSFSTPSPWLSAHILTSIVAYAILLMASIQALLVYLRDRALKQKKSITHKLPPIMRMELLLFRLLLIGFIVLTISLLTSFAFFDQWFSPHFIHKTVLTGLAWILYGGILFAHHYYGLRGKAATKFILLTAIILLLGITGTRLIQEYMFAEPL
ncbi:cytochrome c biogenesis protein CcsA [Ignatzschineria rhizosphaerae]|uniref:Cytochrome c biogenesis protein CcsA n=1 Tax=Ignatzschineria rhizosphaerae TaxID=2923279 RepID=A0ABY3X4C1_9GAMM|nr:cytochrome c biogenesis protein CcsA [Ignatzschineria rhizosphaerae]UNM95625.1 cytochrome c biogenesis protein CcsA [Ignatzschineria rhizosphaerae]